MAVPESIDGKVTKAHFLDHAVELNAKATPASVSSAVTSAVGAHEADTTNVHGIADTTALATAASVTAATATAAADVTARAQPKTPGPFHRMQVEAVGHSYLGVDFSCSRGSRYAEKLAAHLRSTALNTKAYPGVSMADIFYGLWGTADWYSYVSTRSGSNIVKCRSTDFKFGPADEGKAFNLNANIPASTVIMKVLDPETAIMSANATATAADVLTGIVSRFTWTPGTKALCLVDGPYNDAYSANGGLAATLQCYRDSVTTILALLSSSSKIATSSMTTTGTWTAGGTGTAYDWSGGAEKQTVNNGDTLTIPWSTSGDLCVVFRATVGGTGTATVTQGATTLATVDLSNRSNTSPSSRAYSPVPVLLRGLSSGNIVITKTGGAAVNVQDAIVLSSTPPAMLLHKQPYLPTAGYGGLTQAAGDARADSYNSVLDSVAALFPTSKTVDSMSDSGYARATWVNAANAVHPGDQGTEVTYRAMLAALSSFGYTAGVNAV